MTQRMHHQRFFHTADGFPDPIQLHDGCFAGTLIQVQNTRSKRTKGQGAGSPHSLKTIKDFKFALAKPADNDRGQLAILLQGANHGLIRLWVNQAQITIPFTKLIDWDFYFLCWFRHYCSPLRYKKKQSYLTEGSSAYHLLNMRVGVVVLLSL